MKGEFQQTLLQYNYNKNKPLFSTSNYALYAGTKKQSQIPVTIKTLKFPHLELSSYLQKLKTVKSQNVIKIYELVIEQSNLLLITEPVIFSNLNRALKNCQYLDEPDAIFISKQILSGHVDLLRSNVNWFGTDEDIQFAQDGQIKLSWNNGSSFNLINPIPALIAKLSKRTYDQGPNSILPFPISKSLEELIRISNQNASQISMNPQMKKKQKLIKKKGKNWIGLKEYKNKNEYFQEMIYFAVHLDHGFIRVKVYDQGKVSSLIQLNKTKSSFTKVLQMYDQNNKTNILSEYSNDGNLQAYVTRLKTAGVKLKEEQIEFFVYSLLQPIKMIQSSSSKAICMLHIRNIFIQFGIPKIGEPIPLNEKINQVLVDRKDVPDFYHPEFKTDPTQRKSNFDTYSLGVLLYKLMYTEMPIFPEPGKVHIPTVPNYNKRLKESVELFLTQNSSINELEEKIEMNERVRKQIEQNNGKLNRKLKKGNDETVTSQQKGEHQSEDQQIVEQDESSQENENGEPDDQDQEDQEPTWWDHLKIKLKLKEPKKIDQSKRKSFIDQLELSSFKRFRLWSKSVVILVLYVFLFYYKFIQNSISLLASQGLLTKIDLTIDNRNVSVITTDRYQFEKTFNQTTKSINDLTNMNCLIQDDFTGHKYSSVFKEDSPIWYGYLFGGLAVFLFIIIFKIIQIHVFDEVNAWFKKQQGQGHFNMLNWVLLQLHWLNLISGHYFLFHFVFQPQIQPCLGHWNGYKWGSTNAYFENQSQFIVPYGVVFVIQMIGVICYLLLIVKNAEMSEKYNKVMNTLSIFGSILIVVWLMVRLSVILGSYYYPGAAKDSDKVILYQIRHGNYILVFALMPEIIFFMEMIVSILINWLYYSFMDKTQRLLNNEGNLDASLKEIV